MKTRVKICCIQTLEEARLAVRYGASAIGLVSAMPSGLGPISEDLIAEIAPSVPPGVSTFLLTSSQEADSIIAQQRRTRVNTLQLVDAVPVKTYESLRHVLHGVAIVQVVHVRGEESIEEARSVAPYVDAILLDSGDPTLPVKQLGGTGRTHDWTISRRIRDEMPVPVFLAGGLTARNVAEAIHRVHPYAVDVCSGVRTGNRLDERKLSLFFRAVENIVE
ncbi:MAG: phosphoribosylanthranilate isomerase [Ignavibacteria bacterium]|nr:phosphoribosylanthranilate isomerase [Ignavibacteria bacterium]